MPNPSPRAVTMKPIGPVVPAAPPETEPTLVVDEAAAEEVVEVANPEAAVPLEEATAVVVELLKDTAPEDEASAEEDDPLAFALAVALALLDDATLLDELSDATSVAPDAAEQDVSLAAELLVCTTIDSYEPVMSP